MCVRVYVCGHGGTRPYVFFRFRFDEFSTYIPLVSCGFFSCSFARTQRYRERKGEQKSRTNHESRIHDDYLKRRSRRERKVRSNNPKLMTRITVSREKNIGKIERKRDEMCLETLRFEILSRRKGGHIVVRQL